MLVTKIFITKMAANIIWQMMFRYYVLYNEIRTYGDEKFHHHNPFLLHSPT